VIQSLFFKEQAANEIEFYVDDPAVDWQAEPAAILSPVEPLDL
jgi:catechol-2,3-dioxygenase